MDKKITLEYILLSIILILALRLRLYKINTPLADWHSWRQADTSAVSRNFIKLGFDFLHPCFDDLSNVASGKENPLGYRFVEFPIYNGIHAFLGKSFPVFGLEIWGRLTSIVFSLISLIFLYLITKRYLGVQIALLAAFFFAVLPFNIYYSRTILPESMMVMTALGMIYYFDLWIERNSKSKTSRQGSRLLLKTQNLLNLTLALFFAAISFLLKPYALVFILPITYSAWQKWHFNYLKWLTLFFYFLTSLVPFLWWRWWMSRYPEGIPAYTWLFNEGGIRLKGAWFWWLFSERIGRLILGSWGLILFGLGLLARPKKEENLFFYSWLAAILAYFVVIAGGNVRHDYYQIIAIPIVCIFLAKGVWFLLSLPRKYFHRLFGFLLFVICLLFMLAFSWHEVRGFFNINHPEIVEAGKEADKILPPDAKVIAPYNGDTAFLYQINRQGWPVITDSVEYLINRGATHYVSISFDKQTQEIMNKYKIVEKSGQFVIVDLVKAK